MKYKTLKYSLIVKVLDKTRQVDLLARFPMSVLESGWFHFALDSGDDAYFNPNDVIQITRFEHVTEEPRDGQEL